MMNSTAMIFALILLGFTGQAQDWQLIKTTQLETSCELSSKDRNNNLYIADLRGSIYQYDQQGNQLNLYSTKQLGQIYLLESWQGLRTFAFYQDLQEYLIADRFLSNERTYQLPPNSYIRLATLSQDLNLWTLGEDNLLLRKINTTDQSIMIENQWSSDFADEDINVTYLKEYKNRLYLLDKGQRVIVFDNFGNYITKIKAEGVQSISFTDTYLWANKANSVIKINLNSLEREVLTLPIISDQVYVIHGVYYLIWEDRLSLYNYKPL